MYDEWIPINVSGVFSALSWPLNLSDEFTPYESYVVLFWYWYRTISQFISWHISSVLMYNKYNTYKLITQSTETYLAHLYLFTFFTVFFFYLKFSLLVFFFSHFTAFWFFFLRKIIFSISHLLFLPFQIQLLFQGRFNFEMWSQIINELFFPALIPYLVTVHKILALFEDQLLVPLRGVFGSKTKWNLYC